MCPNWGSRAVKAQAAGKNARLQKLEAGAAGAAAELAAATTALERLRGEHAAATAELTGQRLKGEEGRKLLQGNVAELQEAHRAQAAKSQQEWQARLAAAVEAGQAGWERKYTALEAEYAALEPRYKEIVDNQRGRIRVLEKELATSASVNSAMTSTSFGVHSSWNFAAPYLPPPPPPRVRRRRMRRALCSASWLAHWAFDWCLQPDVMPRNRDSSVSSGVPSRFAHGAGRRGKDAGISKPGRSLDPDADHLAHPARHFALTSLPALAVREKKVGPGRGDSDLWCGSGFRHLG